MRSGWSPAPFQLTVLQILEDSFRIACSRPTGHSRGHRAILDGFPNNVELRGRLTLYRGAVGPTGPGHATVANTSASSSSNPFHLVINSSFFYALPNSIFVCASSLRSWPTNASSMSSASKHRPRHDTGPPSSQARPPASVPCPLLRRGAHGRPRLQRGLGYVSVKWLAYFEATVPPRSFSMRAPAMRMSAVNICSLRSSPLVRFFSSAGDKVCLTRPRRSPGAMLNPPGPWRSLSSPLDVISQSPFARRIKSRRICYTHNVLYYFTGGNIVR